MDFSQRSAALAVPALVLLMSVDTVNADAVTESMELAMKECVSANASRIGSPIADTDTWANVVAGSTVVAYSMVNLFGTEGHADVEEAIKVRAWDTLISTLEQKGFKSFRSQALETLDYCMPSALVAAGNEMERQKTAACPDDTSYRKAVSILTATDTELRSEYGNSASEIQSMSLMVIELEILQAFPEIFRYGKDEHPEFSENEYQGLHAALEKVEFENFLGNRPHVDAALNSLRQIDGEQLDRIKVIQRELTCIKDWFDIYPGEEIKVLMEN